MIEIRNHRIRIHFVLFGIRYSVFVILQSLQADQIHEASPFVFAHAFGP